MCVCVFLLHIVTKRLIEVNRYVKKYFAQMILNVFKVDNIFLGEEEGKSYKWDLIWLSVEWKRNTPG